MRAARKSVVLVVAWAILITADSLQALPTQLHTVIAFDAAFLPGVPSEVRSHLGNPEDCLPHSRETLCEGTYDEDADIDPRTESNGSAAWLGVFNSGTHFWNPDGGPAGGMLAQVGPVPVNLGRRNAYQRALELYDAALGRYRSDPAGAHYLLGRAVHLIGDMATPAHVHLDPHVSDSDPTGDDSYEEYLAERYVRPGKLSGRTALEQDFPLSGLFAPDPSGLPSEGHDSEHPLFRLFLSLARLSQQFDSDDGRGTLDDGSTRGRSISLAGGMPDRVSALSSQQEVTFPDALFGFPPARGKLVIPGVVLSAMAAAEPPFTTLRLQFADRSEEHPLSEFMKSDLSDGQAAHIAAVLLPAAVGHTAALYRLFWEETHRDLSRDLPRLSLSRTPRELRVVRPSSVTLELDIDPAGWRDAEVEVYAWVQAPLQQGHVRLYFDGQWQSFTAFSAMKPLAASLRLPGVGGLPWTLVGDTFGLPDLHFTLTLCLDSSLDGTYTPERSVCGAVLITVTGE